MTVFRAAWICPIDAAPIANGWVAVEAGRIVALGGPEIPEPKAQSLQFRNLGSVVLMPGLVNAHIHLELSWLRGRVPPAATFIHWIAQLFAQRRTPERVDDPGVLAAVDAAIIELRASGTVAVGDISNSLAPVQALANSGLGGLVFHELIGFKERDGRLIDQSRPARDTARGAGTGVTIAPHAPYSVSAELFQAIRQSVDASDLPITSVHLGESPEEVEMLARGTGPWPAILKAVGAWRDDWTPPAAGPVEYLDRLGMIDARTLVVHGVQFGEASLALLAERGATLVTCPRSNQWVGVGAPPIERFYRSGVAVAVGTDSLASVDDLNLFSELKAMRWLAPGVPPRELLKSATLVGARALGIEQDLGSLTPGKRAAMIAVRLDGPVADIEEYLVSGIAPSRIEPLNL